MKRFAVAAWLTALGLVVLAPSLTAGEAEDAVLGVERQRFQAMVEADVETLQNLLADELTYVHSDGRSETKAEYLKAIGDRTTRYLSVQPKQPSVRLYGDVAVGAGLVDFHVVASGRDLTLTSRYTDVYVQRDGRWQLVAWQSTRISAP